MYKYIHTTEPGPNWPFRSQITCNEGKCTKPAIEMKGNHARFISEMKEKK